MAKWATLFIKIIMILLILVSILVYISLKSSLPMLNGQIRANVELPVLIERDKNGISFINAQSANDHAFALGWLHSQERFFQMDLLRRNSAGELAELFGEVALAHDKKIRVHQFRQRAKQRFNELPSSHKSLLNSYTEGVNTGLSELSVYPYEYLLLATPPKQWQQEDSFLVLFSMFMDLQDEYGEREKLLGELHARLMPDVFNFINPNGSEWDATIDEVNFSSPDIPKNSFEPAPIIDTSVPNTETAKLSTFSPFVPYDHEALKGSNSWAVTGQLTPYSSGMLANDMHLGIGVPNIWYRSSAKFSANNQDIEIHGVTLPGTPALIAGTNTHIAWGYTNSYGDWSDLIKTTLSDTDNHYLTAQGPLQFETDFESIRVKGQSPVEITIKKTIWGPVIHEEKNNLYALRWVAHDPEGVNFNLLELVYSRNVESALDIAKTLGIPAQNFTVVDTHGNAAWTIAGAIPDKLGANLSQLQWQIPQDWSQTSTKGHITWNGYLAPSDYPVVINPKSDRIWTGNSRVIGSSELNKIGNGGYALGARSRQIANNLKSRQIFTEADFLAIQLDDKAEFLTPWYEFLTHSVLPTSEINDVQKQSLTTHLSQWQNRASIDSIGYTIVRQFRIELRELLFTELFSQTLDKPTDQINYRTIRSQLEPAMWAMITQQPSHLLPERFTTWNSLFNEALNKTINQLEKQFDSLDNASWGAKNQTNIQHPLSRAIPALGWLLDMPKHQVSGDSYMPKVQGSRFGSSQRMVIAPGHEDTAIFHMPVGQSSHPLSPYFGAGHEDWINGTVSPLLPQATKYRLTLQPK
ncbi:penicillin acylase family protein [Psychrosphaera ytuae]|uniref:Penicillin acylase family protein n=1 Tax=Psychrosphaera ytuae TaxID=2820710 RepID=A0A975DB52_9GAMM|nr:penicillin acylase family protein [Psychrosphaera ytuae]QTH63694.1 penicillin acylase family protein [Psychrosphaera ytuae]